MNLILTTECNGLCPFCFARQSRQDKEPEVMSEMMLQTILNHAHDVRGQKASMLGGEPTLSPHFLKAVDWFRVAGHPVQVTTNLLCDGEIVDKLINGDYVSFLVNIHGCGADPDRRARFLDNLERLSRARYNTCLRLTIYEPDQSLDWLETVLEADARRAVNGLTLSPAIPSCGGVDPYFNDPRDSWVAEVYRRALRLVHRFNPHIVVANDCPVATGCMFPAEIYRELHEAVLELDLRRRCEGCGPCDIFPDGHAIWCYGLYDAPETAVELLSYNGIGAMQQDMHNKLYHYVHKELNGINCDSSSCDRAECRGLCPAVRHQLAKKKA